MHTTAHDKKTKMIWRLPIMQCTTRETSRKNIYCQVILIGIMISAVLFADPPSPDYDRSNTHRNQLLIRASVAELDRLMAQYDLVFLTDTENDEGPYLVAGPEDLPADQLVDLLSQDSGVSAAEPAFLASLPGMDGNTAPGVHLGDIVPDLLQTGHNTNPCWSDLDEPWSGYATQGTAEVIHLYQAHQLSNDCGQGVTVAILDTGIDPSHALLTGALVPGYDFVFGEAGLPSEYRLTPDQSMTTIVEQSMTTIVEQSMTTIVEADRVAILAGQGDALQLGNGIAPILASSSVDVLEDLSLPPFFGHGTMVAGLVRWTAPGASIMPIRVFDGHGHGHVYDIVRAIYWAVDHGADIINMSFTLSGYSHELREALRYAHEQGVVCVAAAGNQGEHTMAYPASFPGVLGIAATTLDDEVAEFSNYGSQVIRLAAPGAGVISTYPGNHYAAGWGTSFAAPIAAGTLALIYDATQGDGRNASRERAQYLTDGSLLIPQLAGSIGHGRLDALGTLLLTE
jgi:hypothetical protein